MTMLANRNLWIIVAIFLLSSCKTAQSGSENIDKDVKVDAGEPAEKLVRPAEKPVGEDVQPEPASAPQPASNPQPALLPPIISPFMLNSFQGNGFGVVAKAIGKMEIGENTLLIHPESIQLRSFGDCSPGCPVIDSVEFELSQEGEKSFSVISESVPIPVNKKLPGVGSLKVVVPAGHPPILLNFTDRKQLAGLRLTLSISGLSRAGNKNSQGWWYTHATPFIAALGLEPPKLAMAPRGEKRQLQARQLVLDGRIADLRQLLKAGVKVNDPDTEGQTLLMFAARGNADMVNLLVAYGANVNAKTPIDKDGNGALTALHIALRQDSVNVVRALIKAGADPQAEANRFWTPMHYAAYLGASKSIRYLHERKVDVDTPFKGGRASTPLMVAAQYEQPSSIRVLIESGADPKRKDSYGEDACSYARFFKKPASIKALGCQ
jgi:hypothetical protein